MLGHRKLNVEDYLAILKRRRWLIILPALVLPIVAVGISFFIPARYLSQTLVLIEDQKVPSDLVQSVMPTNLNTRLASMREQILSRSHIQPIVEHYNLYASKRYSMDDRVDLARKDVLVVPIKSDIANRGGLPGFFVNFTASDARTAQAVCGEITSLFIQENLRAREAATQGTSDFIKGQLEDAKRNLDEQDAKLATFQRQYIGKLPGQDTSNLNMLTSLNTQLEAATQATASLQQNKAYLESMLAQAIQNNQVFMPTASGIPSGPGAPLAGQAEMQSLLAQESDLAAHYTADYPDLKAVRRKIVDLRNRMLQAPPVSPTVAGNPLSAAPSRNDTPAIQQLRAQVHSADLGIEAKQKEAGRIQSAIGLYQERIQASPLVDEQFKALNRDTETSQKIYDDLLTKEGHSKMATDLERRQQGEQFRVMDEPNLPESPTFPNRTIFGLAGLLFGFGVGILVAAFLEYKDTALRTEQDVWTFTKLPTLAVIAYSGPLAAASPTLSLMDKFRKLTRQKHAKEELTKAHV